MTFLDFSQSALNKRYGILYTTETKLSQPILLHRWQKIINSIAQEVATWDYICNKVNL